MKGKLNLELKVVNIDLICLNCEKEKNLDYSNGESASSLKFLNLGTEVLDDFKCEECGCNSFGIHVYYDVKMSRNKEIEAVQEKEEK